MDDTALETSNVGLGKFFYNGDGMTLNLTPLVALVIAGILCKYHLNMDIKFKYYFVKN